MHNYRYPTNNNCQQINNKDNLHPPPYISLTNISTSLASPCSAISRTYYYNFCKKSKYNQNTHKILKINVKQLLIE